MRISKKVEKSMHRENLYVLPLPRDIVGREKYFTQNFHAFRNLRVRHYLVPTSSRIRDGSAVGKRKHVRRPIFPARAPVDALHLGVGDQKNPELYGALREARKHFGKHPAKAARRRGKLRTRGLYRYHPPSFSLTFIPTAEASTLAPFAAFITAPITFPMSFTLVAPVARIASSTNFSTSVSGSAAGR